MQPTAKKRTFVLTSMFAVTVIAASTNAEAQVIHSSPPIYTDTAPIYSSQTYAPGAIYSQPLAPYTTYSAPVYQRQTYAAPVYQQQSYSSPRRVHSSSSYSTQRLPRPVTGYGANIHRNQIIRRELKRAQSGKSVRNVGNVRWQR